MSRHVPEGPRWFRVRIRSRGPFVAVIPPLLLGLFALLVLRLFDSKVSGYLGLIAGVFAAPALPAVGAPFSDSSLYPIGVALSAMLWLIVGAIAARRTTRNPMATWADFWRTFGWLAGGVWAGATVALLIAKYSVGQALVG
jgi:hypothetical protein